LPKRSSTLALGTYLRLAQLMQELTPQSFASARGNTNCLPRRCQRLITVFAALGGQCQGWTVSSNNVVTPVSAL